MISKLESFWIRFIIRFAIGFLFLFAALGQFGYGGQLSVESAKKFGDALSKGFNGTWMGDITVGVFTGLDFARFFLTALPFIFSLLAVMILTGLGCRIALRAGAILLICLGLGKYMQGPEGITTTANDYLFAFIICVALFFYGLADRERQVEAAA